jgi:hypothetical protein
VQPDRVIGDRGRTGREAKFKRAGHDWNVSGRRPSNRRSGWKLRVSAACALILVAVCSPTHGAWRLLKGPGPSPVVVVAVT